MATHLRSGAPSTLAGVAIRVDQKRLEALTPKQRERAMEAMAKLATAREQNPMWFYEPHPKQVAFHSAQSRIKAFFGGNQSGKTTAGLADDLIQALSPQFLPDRLLKYKRFQPPFLCRIMTPDFTATMESVLYEKLRELCPRGALVGNSWEKAYDKQLRVLRFKNGSAFSFMTYEQDLNKFGGATLHRVHYDEEPPERVRNECRIRTVKHNGDEIFTMTPLMGLSWSYDAIWERRDEDHITCVTVDMDDNPHLDDEAKTMVLDGLSEEEKEARKRGRFVHFSGLIYADFEPEVHVIPYHPPPAPELCNVVVGIDPGIRYACAVVWAYLDPHDEMFVFHEHYVPNRTIKEVAQYIRGVNAELELDPIYYVIDPAARNKQQQTGRSDQMEFADHGIVTIAGQNAVTAGLNRVKERLQNRRLFVMDTCPNMISEFRHYRWRDPPKSGEDAREAPVKTRDHLLDALRYVVMSRPYLPIIGERDERPRLVRRMAEDQQRSAGSVAPISEMGGIFL